MHTPGPSQAETKRSPLVALVIIAVVSLGLIHVYSSAVDTGKGHQAMNAGATASDTPLPRRTRRHPCTTLLCAARR